MCVVTFWFASYNLYYHITTATGWTDSVYSRPYRLEHQFKEIPLTGLSNSRIYWKIFQIKLQEMLFSAFSKSESWIPTKIFVNLLEEFIWKLHCIKNAHWIHAVVRIPSFGCGFSINIYIWSWSHVFLINLNHVHHILGCELRIGTIDTVQFACLVFEVS